MREKGVDFPINAPSLDKIIQNSLSRQLDQSARISNTASISYPAQQASHASSNRPSGAIKLNEEQWKKLNGELRVVESNVQVLNEIINELNSRPNKNFEPSDQDLVLMKEIYETCKEMQKRVTQLIGNVSNEGVISKIL